MLFQLSYQSQLHSAILIRSPISHAKKSPHNPPSTVPRPDCTESCNIPIPPPPPSYPLHARRNAARKPCRSHLHAGNKADDPHATPYTNTRAQASIENPPTAVNTPPLSADSPQIDPRSNQISLLPVPHQSPGAQSLSRPPPASIP